MTDTNGFSKNVQFQHRYIMQAQQTIMRYVGYFVQFRLANEIEDTKQSTDAVIELENKATIALRIRRYKKYGPDDKVYRDLTIRAQSKGGGETELHKIRAGWCDWYFYGWLNEHGTMTEYMLLDVARLRSSGLLSDNRKVTPNKGPDNKPDGTGFTSYTINELGKVGAIVVCHVVINGLLWHAERIERAELVALPAHLKDVA